ncbi:unnamed protein product [Amoebophrya sp. A120]|nr:unnamed protein product [Amoebophrya sp. A120]|eukprot:GSA120T00011645001.1
MMPSTSFAAKVLPNNVETVAKFDFAKTLEPMFSACETPHTQLQKLHQALQELKTELAGLKSSIHTPEAEESANLPKANALAERINGNLTELKTITEEKFDVKHSAFCSEFGLAVASLNVSPAPTRLAPFSDLQAVKPPGATEKKKIERRRPVCQRTVERFL